MLPQALVRRVVRQPAHEQLGPRRVLLAAAAGCRAVACGRRGRRHKVADCGHSHQGCGGGGDEAVVVAAVGGSDDGRRRDGGRGADRVGYGGQGGGCRGQGGHGGLLDGRGGGDDDGGTHGHVA